MSKAVMVPQTGRGGLIPASDNPFKADIMRVVDNMKTAFKTGSGDGYQGLEVTITMKAQYAPGRYTKMYHNKELCKMTAAACKLFIYIACNLDYEAQQVHIPHDEVGMDRRTLTKALLELMDIRIIAKVEKKKAMYWVNVTLLIVGNLAKVPNSTAGDDTRV